MTSPLPNSVRASRCADFGGVGPRADDFLPPASDNASAVQADDPPSFDQIYDDAAALEARDQPAPDDAPAAAAPDAENGDESNPPEKPSTAATSKPAEKHETTATTCDAPPLTVASPLQAVIANPAVPLPPPAATGPTGTAASSATGNAANPPTPNTTAPAAPVPLPSSATLATPGAGAGTLVNAVVPNAATSTATNPTIAVPAARANAPAAGSPTPRSPATGNPAPSPLVADNPAQPADPAAAKVIPAAPPEKSAAPAATSPAPAAVPEQKPTLAEGSQRLTAPTEPIGTGTALPDATMRPAPNFALRSFRALDAEQRPAGEENGASSENSSAWKGWTNGGGERVSTAAQFSRIADGSALHFAANPGAATFALNRGHAPAAATATAATTPGVPADETALLAPVGAALERLLTRGQDQLAVTVRFEQGGSLSLKLALRDGSVATHIQTDVPGLQEALRSAWTHFSHDWSQRGIKLSDPSFSSTAGDPGAHRDGRAQDRDGHPLSADTMLFGPARGTRAAHVAGRTSSTINPAQILGTPGVTDARGLRTWA